MPTLVVTSHNHKALRFCFAISPFVFFFFVAFIQGPAWVSRWWSWCCFRYLQIWSNEGRLMWISRRYGRVRFLEISEISGISIFHHPWSYGCLSWKPSPLCSLECLTSLPHENRLAFWPKRKIIFQPAIFWCDLSVLREVKSARHQQSWWSLKLKRPQPLLTFAPRSDSKKFCGGLHWVWFLRFAINWLDLPPSNSGKLRFIGISE